MSLLELRSVTKRYGSTWALAGIDLHVESGSRTAIVGPSGSGKSTLLRIIAGFEAPDAGSIVLDGVRVADGQQSMPPHRRGIGIVAQDGALFPHLTIAENIGYGLSRHEVGRDARIRDLMSMTGLDAALLARRPDQLSGGQQQRVALARSLARRPRLMLLDEPFSALDTGLRAQTRAAVSELLAASGTTTILVTHDQVEALSFAEQVAVMRQGHLPQIGTPREIYLRPVDPMIAAFLGEAIMLRARIERGIAHCSLGLVSIDSDRSGEAEIMLRPEQLSIAALSDAVARNSTDEPTAEVVSIDFAGGSCSAVLRLTSGDPLDGHSPSLRLRVSPIDPPEVGASVRLVVQGSAHVFPGLAHSPTA